MPKDYAKFVPPKSRLNSSTGWPVKITVLIVALVLLGGIGGFYIYQTNTPEHGDFFTKLSDLIHHKKMPPKAATKVASAEPAQPRTVRFDFYEQLPNMQMPAETTIIAAAPAPAAIPAPVLVASTPNKMTTVAPAVPVPAALPVATRPSFNPEELTHLLESEQPKAVAQPAPTVANNHFIIKMGDFDTDAGAKGLVMAIKSVGFDARVVKVSRSGHTIYQVQQGPYETMALATQSQLRMQKRGLISTIVKAI